MLQTTEFFQEQIKQCKDFAARTNNKSDRDFWLKMADRWGAYCEPDSRMVLAAKPGKITG